MNNKIENITGHQSFYLRQSWLTKSVKAIKKGHDIFSNKNLIQLIDEMGIGSNMVKSLRYWVKIFNIVKYQEKKYVLSTEIDELFGLDPTFQSLTSKWILHIWACKNLPTWEIFFVRDKLTSFTKDQLIDRMNVVLHEDGTEYKHKTIKELIDVFINLYLFKENDNPEENKISPLADLKIIEKINKDEFRFRIIHEKDIPKEVILYILENEQNNKYIEFDEAFELIKRYAKIDYYSLRRIIEKLESKEMIHFDKSVGLNNIILKSKFKLESCIKEGFNE